MYSEVRMKAWNLSELMYCTVDIRHQYGAYGCTGSMIRLQDHYLEAGLPLLEVPTGPGYVTSWATVRGTVPVLSILRSFLHSFPPDEGTAALGLNSRRLWTPNRIPVV